MFVCSSLNRSLQTASEGHGFLPTSPCSSRTPEPGASSAICPFPFSLCMLASRLVFDSVADRFGFSISGRRGITRTLLWKSAVLTRSPTETLRLKC